MSFEYLDRNVSEIREKIDAAKKKSPVSTDVVLLAAIKSGDVDEVNYIHRELGITDVGENRVQQLLERYDKLDKEGLNIHFIGSLQTNKVKYIIDKVCMIHSLDSERLAAEIEKQAAKIGKTMDVLVEINIGREENKGGVLPENVEEFCEIIAKYPHLKLRGFMTMAPNCENYNKYLEYFKETYQIVLDIWTKKSHNIDRPILSMGMSNSFEAAIECGSTMVRIGREIFRKE